MLFTPGETEVPLLGALGTNDQCKASSVLEGVVLASSFAWRAAVLPSIRYVNYLESLY